MTGVGAKPTLTHEWINGGLRLKADGEVIDLAATKRTTRWTHLNYSIQNP
jgi:hypothetical protein